MLLNRNLFVAPKLQTTLQPRSVIGNKPSAPINITCFRKSEGRMFWLFKMVIELGRVQFVKGNDMISSLIWAN